MLLVMEARNFCEKIFGCNALKTLGVYPLHCMARESGVFDKTEGERGNTTISHYHSRISCLFVLSLRP